MILNVLILSWLVIGILYTLAFITESGYEIVSDNIHCELKHDLPIVAVFLFMLVLLIFISPVFIVKTHIIKGL
jgi:hypothetical protein